MKRKLTILVAVLALAIGMCACGSDSGQTSDNSNGSIANADEMTKYISSLSKDSRQNFLFFWRENIACCKSLENKLEEHNNTATYEFDPTDESQIPDEIKDIYNFNNFAVADIEKLHGDYKMKIEADEVFLSIGGVEYYPTEYGFTDISDIIDSLN